MKLLWKKSHSKYRNKTSALVKSYRMCYRNHPLCWIVVNFLVTDAIYIFVDEGVFTLFLNDRFGETPLCKYFSHWLLVGVDWSHCPATTNSKITVWGNHLPFYVNRTSLHIWLLRCAIVIESDKFLCFPASSSFWSTFSASGCLFLLEWGGNVLLPTEGILLWRRNSQPEAENVDQNEEEQRSSQFSHMIPLTQSQRFLLLQVGLGRGRRMESRKKNW